jgi:hypothetical protein
MPFNAMCLKIVARVDSRAARDSHFCQRVCREEIAAANPTQKPTSSQFFNIQLDLVETLMLLLLSLIHVQRYGKLNYFVRLCDDAERWELHLFERPFSNYVFIYNSRNRI